MFRDIIDGCLFKDGFVFGIINWVIVLFTALAAGLLLLLIVNAGVWCFDKLTLDVIGPYESSAKIVNKQFKASYTTTYFIKVGDVMVPQTLYHPEQHLVTIRVETIQEDFITDNRVLYEQKEKEISSIYYYDMKRWGQHVRYELKD